MMVPAKPPMKKQAILKNWYVTQSKSIGIDFSIPKTSKQTMEEMRSGRIYWSFREQKTPKSWQTTATFLFFEYFSTIFAKSFAISSKFGPKPPLSPSDPKFGKVRTMQFLVFFNCYT